MVISFSNDKARFYLLKHGFVYTLRNHSHKLGKDWLNSGRGNKKICDVFIKEIKYDHINCFVKHSGFESLEEWLEEYLKLNRKINQDMSEMHLYLVELLYSASLIYYLYDWNIGDII